MKRLVCFFSIAMTLLLATAGVLSLPRAASPVPLRAPLDQIPTTVAGWRSASSVPDAALPVDPQASDHLLRAYTNGAETVWVSLGYYGAQTEGHRPRAQQLLYPGGGWTDLSAESLRIPLEGGQSIGANFLVLRTNDRQVGILYWYEMRGRSIASDHWYRSLLLYNRLVHGRADGALVRIAAPIGNGGAAAARQTLAGFVRVFFPEISAALGSGPGGRS